MNKILFYLLAVLLANGGMMQVCLSQNGEEFTGPYKSWADVKQRFGAKGDGVSDDTKALQLAVDSLTVVPTEFNTGSRAYTTIYLPAGTYRISETLVLRGKIGINIIGEHPDKVMIKWMGKAADTMLWANGSAYFKISRITWNADQLENMDAIGLYWKDRWNERGKQSFAQLNIEISDCNFIGKCRRGISGGTYNDTGTGANDSEVAILRCTFTECKEAGINIKGFNALDYWIWDCRFIKCYTGVTCTHGNYHIYRSYFERSESDVLNDNGYYTSMRGCYSMNPNAVSFDKGGSCNPFKRIFQANTITATSLLTINYYHLGKLTFFDNIFKKTISKVENAVLDYHSWCPGVYEVLSVNNRYEISNPIRMEVPKKKIYSVGDITGKPAIINTAANFLASQQTRPAQVQRTVLDVPRNANSKTIQSIIDQAAALKGKRPVVHFPFGTYYITNTLKIPAGSDMQIAGDGNIYASVLKKGDGFPPAKPLMEVEGPSYITIRDLQVGDDSGRSETDAIVFTRVDRPGSQVFIDQLYSSADHSVELDGLDHLYVQKDNSFFSYGNTVAGGKLVQQGKGTAGLYCYGGQFGKLSVQQNGRFVAKDCWWEGKDRIPLNLNGSGNITIDGFMLAPNNADSGTSITVNTFKGRISLLNAYVQGAVQVAPANPGLDLLLWNIHFYHKMDPVQFARRKTTYRAALAGLSSQCFTKDPACQNIVSIDDQFINIGNNNDFLLETTLQDRQAMPRKFEKRSGNASNVYMSRITIGQCNTAIKFVR